jgi:uncharacterized membrane protein affecting hemolysin expression
VTYDEIVKALDERKCMSTEAALDSAVYAEAQALIKGASRYNKLRNKLDTAKLDARDFYADDITRQLNEPVSPTPSRMLNLRRFSVVWAVAEVLRTNDDVTAGGTKKV